MNSQHETEAKELIASLSKRLDDTLRKIDVAESQVALLDWPHHTNSGDSAIWTGEVATLARLGTEVVYRSSLANLSSAELRKRLPKGCAILLQGGGNFGDLYPDIHNFRKRILREFQDYRIVQLTQSIHFSTPEAVSETAALIRSHPDFTFLARDMRSADIASEFGCVVHLTPDFAFGIGPVDGPQPTLDSMWLIRSDIEKLHDSPVHLPSNSQIEDWPGTAALSFREPKVLPALLTLHGLSVLNKLQPFVGSASVPHGGFYDRIARLRVDRGFSMLGRGQIVVTDRLHGHILSTLMGRPQVILDNRIGKIANFFSTWTKDVSFVRFAESPEEAIAMIRSER